MDNIFYILGVVLLIYFLVTKIPGLIIKKRSGKDLKLLRRIQGEGREGNIEEKDIAHLPKVVKDWLRKSNLVGSPWMKTAYIKQRGQMRLDPNSEKWIFASSTQVVGLLEPAFAWQVKAEIYPLVHVYGKDTYLEGQGSLQMRLLNIVKVAQQRGGEKVNQSSLQRYLLEMPWYPQAALNKNMRWTQIDRSTAKVTIDHKGVKGEAYFRFDQEGDVVHTSAMRYKDVNEDAGMLECVGESREINVMDGIRMPISIDVTWRLPEGMYTWYKVSIAKLQYRK